MEYEGRICRAPMERASYMLPVMVGCSYNKCKFCNLFRDLKYRELPLEQVEEELQRVKNLGGNPRKIFLASCCVIVLPPIVIFPRFKTRESPARATPSISIPWCVVKFLSSIEIIASFAASGIS